MSYSNKVTCVLLTLNVAVPAIKVFVCVRVCVYGLFADNAVFVWTWAQ